MMIIMLKLRNKIIQLAVKYLPFGPSKLEFKGPLSYKYIMTSVDVYETIQCVSKKGNPYSKAQCSKVNRFENVHVVYK